MFKKSPNAARFVHRWQKRWFVLTENALTYWEKAEYEGEKDPLGIVEICHAMLPDPAPVKAEDHKAVETVDLTLKVGDREFFLRTNNPEDRVAWSAALGGVCGGGLGRHSRIDLPPQQPPSAESRLERRLSAESAETASLEVVDISDVVIGKQVGFGPCSDTKEGTLHGKPIAAKILYSYDSVPELVDEFKMIAQSIYGARHANVVRCLGASVAPPDLVLIMERYASNLERVLDAKKKVDIPQRLAMARDVAAGMEYVHAYYGVHGALKSSNCLVSDDGTVCVSDFGFTKVKAFATAKNVAGQYSFTAPEVLQSQPATRESDVYSFGVILWQLATGDKPWEGATDMDLLSTVGYGGQHVEMPADADERLASLAKLCLLPAPSDRADFAQLREKLDAMLA